MEHDNARNPMFWGHSTRKDWPFGYDAGQLHTDEDNEVPALPPLPPVGSSVYSKTKGHNVKL